MHLTQVLDSLPEVVFFEAFEIVSSVELRERMEVEGTKLGV